MNAPEYRTGVCVVLTRQTGTSVLVCHRIGAQPDEGWQFPQGGRDPALPVLDEARRELREEIGADRIQCVRQSRREYSYDIPPDRRRPGSRWVGQRHVWLLARLLAEDRDISFAHQPAEFDGFRWVTPEEALAGAVWFKRQAYKGGLRDLGLL